MIRFGRNSHKEASPYNKPVLTLSLSITEESINIGFVAVKINWKISILP